MLGAKSLDAMIGIDEDDTDFQIPHETAENIGQFYCGMLERVGLKPHTNTTDAPSVMELFRQSIVGVTGLRCLSHVLHNAIKKACEVMLIKSDVDKLRNLCTEIKNSSILSGQLANLAKGAGKRKIKVVLDCKWRWGYSRKMIQRYRDLKDEIDQLNCEHHLRPFTITRLTELSDMLEDCCDVLFFMEGSKYVTLSCVPFVLYYLKNHLQPRDEDDLAVASARNAILEYITARYALLPIHYLAAYLDPRFSNMDPFVPHEMRQLKIHEVHYIVVERAGTIQPPSTAPEPAFKPAEDSTPTSTQPQRKKQKLMEKIRSDLSSRSSSSHHVNEQEHTTINEEMNRYEKKEPLPIESCPLAWWKKNEIEFPLLSVVAKEILSIPASSAPSERVFSKLGRLYTQRRDFLCLGT